MAQKEEFGILVNVEEYNFLAHANEKEDQEELNTNCIFIAKLPQASSDTEDDVAPTYDTDASSKVPQYDACYNNDMFIMFAHEEKHTDLPKSITTFKDVDRRQEKDREFTQRSQSMKGTGQILLRSSYERLKTKTISGIINE